MENANLYVAAVYKLNITSEVRAILFATFGLNFDSTVIEFKWTVFTLVFPMEICEPVFCNESFMTFWNKRHGYLPKLS